MFWKRKRRNENEIVIAYLQRRLVEQVEELKANIKPNSNPEIHLAKLDWIISLFHEVGHLYLLEGRPRDEAQIKAQAAKFLLLLPARRDFDRLAAAEKWLLESIATLRSGELTFSLADAHAVLGDLLLRRAMETKDPEARRAALSAARENLEAALAVAENESLADRWRDDNQPNRPSRELYLTDLFNKLGSLRRNLATANPVESFAHLTKAHEYYSRALTYCPRSQAPELYAVTQNNLGMVGMLIAGQAADEATLNEAEKHFRDALQAVEKGRQPHLYAMLHSNLGELMLAFTGTHAHSRYELLQSAMSHFGEALPFFPQDHYPLQYARILFGQGRALAMMGQKDAARQLFQEAYDFRSHLPDNGRQIEKALAELS